jgi:hypothetical protein
MESPFNIKMTFGILLRSSVLGDSSIMQQILQYIHKCSTY